jgi:hypothetical protein
MADSPPDPGSRGPTTGAPRWVKVFGIIALVLAMLVVVLLLSGGNHGPGRHTSSGDAGDHTPPAGGHAP